MNIEDKIIIEDKEKLKKTILQLYFDGEYEKVVSLSQDRTDELESEQLLYLSGSLYKLARYNESLEIAKLCRKRSKGDELELKKINNRIGWCGYQLNIKYFDKSNKNLSDLVKYVDWIVKNTEMEKYSPYEKSVKKLVDVIHDKDRISIDYEMAEKYLSMLDPKELDSSPIQFKEKELPSEREKWYMRKSKCLVELGKYKECVEFVDKIFLTSSMKFHNDNNIWLRYRQAISYRELNDLDNAKRIIESCLLKKEHWCFYEQMYQVFKLEDDIEKALKFGSLGALTKDPHRLKVSLYEDMGRFLIEKNMNESGLYHLRMTNIIREKNSWKIKEDIDLKLEGSDIKNKSEKEVMNNLAEFWKLYRLRGEEHYEGKIKKFIGDGRAGFIAGNSGTDYYFLDKNFKDKSISTGDEVKFLLKETFDKKKNKNSFEAMEIEKISS